MRPIKLKEMSDGSPWPAVTITGMHFFQIINPRFTKPILKNK
jgi:hypothetical protein